MFNIHVKIYIGNACWCYLILAFLAHFILCIFWISDVKFREAPIQLLKSISTSQIRLRWMIQSIKLWDVFSWMVGPTFFFVMWIFAATIFGTLLGSRFLKRLFLKGERLRRHNHSHVQPGVPRSWMFLAWVGRCCKLSQDGCVWCIR